MINLIAQGFQLLLLFLSSRSIIPRKLPKINVGDDVEEMRQQFELWEQDDCKENKIIKEKKQPGK